MKTPVLFICSLFLFTVSCINSVKDVGISRLYDNEFQAKKIFLQSSIVCPKGDCPSFVGGLYNISPGKMSGYRVGGCSTSLIAPDQVLTNAHCIPEDIAQIGNDCGNRIRIVFPKTSQHPLETLNCLKILNKSPLSEKAESPDWAILKLDRASKRTPLILNHNGIQSMEPVTLHKINFRFNDLSPLWEK